MREFYFASPTAKPEAVGSTGRLFKKQVLPIGSWVDPLYPDEHMEFEPSYLSQIVENFKKRIAGRISAPSFHTDDSAFNKGEVVDVELEDDGLYAYIDIRDEETAKNIDKDNIWDVSAKFTDNYQDTKTGEWFGPTLLHVALVNNPYIKQMNPFQALSEAIHSKFGQNVRMLSETSKEKSMSKITNNRSFPVDVTLKEGDEDKKVTLQPNQELEVADDQAEGVQGQLNNAVEPKEEEKESESDDKSEEADGSADDKSEEEQSQGDQSSKELSETQRELAETKRKLARRDIEDGFKDLLRGGHAVPAMKKSYVELAEALHGQSRQLSDGTTQNLSDSLASFVATIPKIVSLDDEKGTNQDDTQKSPWEKLGKEQREKLQASGVTPEQYNKNGGKNGLSAAELIAKKEDK